MGIVYKEEILPKEIPEKNESFLLIYSM